VNWRRVLAALGRIAGREPPGDIAGPPEAPIRGAAASAAGPAHERSQEYDQRVLFDLACTDPVRTTRRAAVDRVTDARLLGRLAFEAPDPGVRARAVDRLKDQPLLLRLFEEDRVDWIRLRALGNLEPGTVDAIADPALTMRIALFQRAREGVALANRVRAVARLDDPFALRRLVAGGTVPAAVREAAATTLIAMGFLRTYAVESLRSSTLIATGGPGTKDAGPRARTLHYFGTRLPEARQAFRDLCRERVLYRTVRLKAGFMRQDTATAYDSPFLREIAADDMATVATFHGLYGLRKHLEPWDEGGA